MSVKGTILRMMTDILVDMIGGALYAAGVCSFASAAEFAPGGIAGLAVIVHHFTDFPIGLCTMLFNIPIVILCIRTLGKHFLVRSLRTMVISTVLMDVVFPLLPAYTGDRLTAAIFAGVLSGIGLALIYWRKSSTGGTDFLILSLQKKIPHLSIGSITIVIDGSVILLGGLVFGDIDALLYGVLMTALCTVMIDKITGRFISGQMVLIVTDDGELISKVIMDEVGRGVTAMDAEGMYSGSSRRVLLCACSRAEAVRIRKLTAQRDENALVVLCPFDTAYGLGFHPHDD